MAADPFEGCWHRVRRARTHRHSIERKWDAFLKQNPYSPHFDVDDEGYGSVWFERSLPVPPSIPILFGEYFYNLRAALDYCAFATAIIDSKQDPPPDEGQIQFPIYSNLDAFWANHYRIHPLSEEHQFWLEAIQPCAGGKDQKAAPLYWINKLANRDRHRQLHVVGAYVTRSSPVVRSSQLAEIIFEDVDPYQFVEDRTEIARFQITPCLTGDKVEANPNSTLDVELMEFARQRTPDTEWLFWPLRDRMLLFEGLVDYLIGQFERDCVGSTSSFSIDKVEASMAEKQLGRRQPHD